MVKSLDKGKRFERDVVSLLSLITGVKWLRVPMSGAFSTKNKSTDHRFSGDIFTEDPIYCELVIECKSTKSRINLEDLANKKSLFWKWIYQAARESYKNPWILFFKANHGKMWAVEKVNIKTKSNYSDSFGFKPILILGNYLIYEVNDDVDDVFEQRADLYAKIK